MVPHHDTEIHTSHSFYAILGRDGKFMAGLQGQVCDDPGQALTFVTADLAQFEIVQFFDNQPDLRVVRVIEDSTYFIREE